MLKPGQAVEIRPVLPRSRFVAFAATVTEVIATGDHVNWYVVRDASGQLHEALAAVTFAV